MAASPVAVAPQSALPMAIPLAKPLPQEPIASAEPSSPMMGDLKINRKIRRRRSSKSFALVAMFLMFGMLAGGAYLIIQNWTVFENLGGLAKANDPSVVDSTDGSLSDDGAGGAPIVSPSDVSDDADVDSRPLPKIDLTKLDELDEE
ncbi:MAG: hypothetical protein GY904_17170, partial [Planctomycetaceae bacterium]|nr:hypothetical protein [Planctomycetaceae bacterium]